ncbi:hypothetical protein N665_0152s0023 [Sinapis alba]|nr:hypothetical protein N665_0152s0023 [Sinapis alba]
MKLPKESGERGQEASKKYLESSGVVDSLTKVLFALNEKNDKPTSTFEIIQQKLGGPLVSDYKKLHAEKSELQINTMIFWLNIHAYIVP